MLIHRSLNPAVRAAHIADREAAHVESASPFTPGNTYLAWLRVYHEALREFASKPLRPNLIRRLNRSSRIRRPDFI